MVFHPQDQSTVDKKIELLAKQMAEMHQWMKKTRSKSKPKTKFESDRLALQPRKQVDNSRPRKSMGLPMTHTKHLTNRVTNLVGAKKG